MKDLITIILLAVIVCALHFAGVFPAVPNEVQKRMTFAEACRANRSDYCREFFQDLAEGRSVRSGSPSHPLATTAPPPGIPIEDYEPGDSD